MLRQTVLFVLLSLAAASAAVAQPVEPSYSRGGFDYYSAPVEPATTRPAPTACEKLYGKHVEVQQVEKSYRCSVITPSEPRLSAKLAEEVALADSFPEPKRQKVVDALVDKYKKLAQCPAGTQAAYDGTMYSCVRTLAAKELCPAGAATALDSGEVGCVVSSCAKGLTDLGALTKQEHPGCFKCPKGSYDANETEAFHGALQGMPGPFTDVFCKAASGGP
jgi:hypothetical protein